MGEFVGEFIGHYVAVEGPLWRTLGLLIFRPGRLTNAYMAGKRVLYTQPLRLFLTMSVILFALLQFGGFSIGNDEIADARRGGLKFSADVKAADASPAPAPATAPDGIAYSLPLGYYGLSFARTGRESALRFELSLPDTDEPSLAASAMRALVPNLDQRLQRFGALSPQQKAERMTKGFFSRMPYVIFFMVPVMALFLKLLYWRSGRRYGEFLLFALHVTAFAFVVIMLMRVTPWLWSVGLLGIWLLAYLARAMHNVYGGPPAATAVRWLALVVAYLLTLMVAISQVMLALAMASA
jgi:hypothetical protein